MFKDKERDAVQIALTERFLRDFQGLSGSLANKCREMIGELKLIDPSALRESALPGWRLHALRNSGMVSLSLDMNFRALAELKGDTLILHRAVKHDTADRPEVNRNVQAAPVGQIADNELSVSGVYDALRAFGVPEAEAVAFRGCGTEDDLLRAAAGVSAGTGDLALTLYETSGLIVPQSRFHVLQRDEDFVQILKTGGTDWQIYLHPSQSFIVELPTSFRTAVVGSAGTGKTVCAWHRTKYLMDAGASVGFVCPDDQALDVSKKRLLTMAGPSCDRSYFFVPRSADELLQLAATVDHLVLDETQEIAVTWLTKLSASVPSAVGLTLFYDFNQLGGHISNGDTARYKRRIHDWKTMLGTFPRLQKFSLSINYRNAREIADYYLALLSEALPTKPLADVPAFEAGEVLEYKTTDKDLVAVVANLLRQLLREHSSQDIGVVTVDKGANTLRDHLGQLKFSVSERTTPNAVVVTDAAGIRGHERQVMIVITKDAKSLRRNFGVAIDAYIALSRAVKQLIVVEALGR